MLGILQGLKVTIKHFFGPKLTRFYPYEKRVLPERSRGLIQLITEPATGVLKCESCLLCEKECPPRAITISYQRSDTFRNRPLSRPKSKAAYYRARMASAHPYEGPRPLSPAVMVSGVESEAKLAAVDRIVSERADLVDVLSGVQAELGYLPRQAMERVAGELDVPLSELYSVASLSPDFQLAPSRRAQTAGGKASSDASSPVMPGAEAIKAVGHSQRAERGRANG
jgi:ferredoxin